MSKRMNKPGDGFSGRPSPEQVKAAHDKQRHQASQKALLRKIEKELREAADGKSSR